jgi:C4-dicarboxylate-specific signal transduction histidine kinase
MWIEITARAETLASGATLRVEAIMRDVTDRKKLQDQGRELAHQSSQSEKMASLGQTMSGVAHELNNPLATILACAERLTGQRLDDVTRRDLDAIHNAAERAARIVRNLQTFARKRHTTRMTVDINQVVRETLALRAYDQRGTQIAILDALASSLPPVFVDPHQIQQIVLNLVINAEQAMLESHGRGTLTLRSWHDAESDAVVLEVADDGPGVPDQVQDKVFEPFFTTKPVGKGTRADRRLCHCAGAWLPHQRVVAAGRRRVVSARAAGERRVTAHAGADAHAAAAGRTQGHARTGRGRRARARRRGGGGARR